MEQRGHFEVERIPGTKRANVYCGGEYRCQLIVGRELETWLFQSNRSFDDNARWAVEEAAARRAHVEAYLAVRAARNVETSLQMSLF